MDEFRIKVQNFTRKLMLFLNNRVTGIQMLTINHTFQHSVDRVRMTLFEPKSISRICLEIQLHFFTAAFLLPQN